MVSSKFLRIIKILKLNQAVVVLFNNRLIMYCYYGNFATEFMKTIDDMAYDSNWFNFPVEMQKYFIMIISRSHKQAYFNGFGFVPCSLEMLGQV